MKVKIEKTIIRVAVGIIWGDGKILCCQRKKGARYELQWEFPGGKFQEGEIPEECLRREIFEELNIIINSPRFYDKYVQHYPDDGVFEVYYYAVEDYSGDLKNRTFEQVAWVSPLELPKLNFLDGNKNVIERLVSEHSVR